MKHMATMQAMGFEEDACRSALEACGGDVGQAIETLCSQQKRLEAFNESPKAEVVDGKTIYISGNETLVIDGDESDDEDPSFEHSSTVYDANGTAMSPLTREMANAMAEGIENAAIEFKKSMELQNMVTLYDEVTSSDHGSEGEAKGSRLEGEEDADVSSESSPQGDVEEILGQRFLPSSAYLLKRTDSEAAWECADMVENSEMLRIFSDDTKALSAYLGRRIERRYPGYGVFLGTVSYFRLGSDDSSEPTEPTESKESYSSGPKKTSRRRKDRRDEKGLGTPNKPSTLERKWRGRRPPSIKSEVEDEDAIEDEHGDALFVIDFDDGTRENVSFKRLVALFREEEEQGGKENPSIDDSRTCSAIPSSKLPIRLSLARGVVFSFALFCISKSRFRFYRDSAVKFIIQAKLMLPSCSFVAHVNSRLPRDDLELLAKAAQGDIKFIEYEYNKKSGGHWVICAMRFSTLWEHEGPEIVAVVDVHDNASLMLKELHKIVHLLGAQKRTHALTYWESDEPVCANNSSLPLKGHCHTDGGLCVWMEAGRKGLPMPDGEFQAFCERVLQQVARVPHGADEMLLDSFLQTWRLTDRVLFIPHRHLIRDRDVAVKEIDSLELIEFTGELDVTKVCLDLGTRWTPQSMYICSEREDENQIKARLKRDEMQIFKSQIRKRHRKHRCKKSLRENATRLRGRKRQRR